MKRSLRQRACGCKGVGRHGRLAGSALAGGALAGVWRWSACPAAPLLGLQLLQPLLCASCLGPGARIAAVKRVSTRCGRRIGSRSSLQLPIQRCQLGKHPLGVAAPVTGLQQGRPGGQGPSVRQAHEA